MVNKHFFKHKRVLVTGGNGFVGSHLVERLVELRSEVFATRLTEYSNSYLESKKVLEKANFSRVDFTDFESIFDLITRQKIEIIFHLGAQALVDVALANPRRTFHSNVMGTVNILESARLCNGVKSVVIASSDKAYGKLDKKKYIETDPLKGDHPYEASKSAADLAAYTYYKTYGVPVVVSRFGNIYGQGDLNFSRIIPAALKALASDETLELRSDGTHIRDFLYVKDVVDGYLLLAEHINDTKGQAYNFGSQDSYSVKELLKLIEEALDQKLVLKYLHTAHNEIPYQSLDYSKIKKELGWETQYNLKQVLPQMFEWYKQYLAH